MIKMLSLLAMSAVIGAAMCQTTNQTPATTQAPAAVQTAPYTTHIDKVVKNSNVSWEDAAAAIALARALNMDSAAIITQAQSQPNVSIYQCAPAFIIQQQSGKAFGDIFTMYNNGQTWMQIAQNCNVPASYYNPNNVENVELSNADFTQNVWQTILQKNYGMTPDDAVFFTNSKTPMNELVVAEVVAREDNTPVRDVMNAYNGNKDWGAIDQQFALNQSNPVNQSQITQNPNAVPGNPPPPPIVANPIVAPPPVAVPAPNNNLPPSTPAQTQTQTTTTTTQTQTVTPPPTTGEETTTTTSHLTAQAAPSPTEEWQIQGGNINPYNGWTNAQIYTSTYALHTHHRKYARRHRMRRHTTVKHRSVHRYSHTEEWQK